MSVVSSGSLVDQLLRRAGVDTSSDSWSYRSDTTPEPPAGWLTRQETARRLGIGLRTLDGWRAAGHGPRAVRLKQRLGGGRGLTAIYREKEVEAFCRLMFPRRKGRPVILTSDADQGARLQEAAEEK